MLDVKGISYSLKNGRKILDGIGFSVGSGELCAVIGPNGAGKSTLMKVITGLINPSDGSVQFMKTDLMSLVPRARAKVVAYLPQITHAVSSSVSDAVLLGRKPYISWYPSADDRELVSDVAFRLGIDHLLERNVTELSGGELQKVLIARALVQETFVLILDEPVNHLDVKNQIDIMETTRQLTRESGLATLVVIHDLNLALRYADSVLLLDGGKQAVFCRSSELKSGCVSDVYNIPMDIREIDGRRCVIY
ncbi:ABC transporter ATP-binding protein [Seleniivibrio sp.]|uniref:ABC transporter ATP-binding protein n=1 Tax=Seleniivibrio sp. TaxID=2898801 RepID=UPI0025ECDE1C|nr:ABC transporter ATP-binding protein [Seleniivibrio sp.]MCD8553477.1 ABC transporter ATP-binding protein [Seleniivibrio sp.]